MLKTASQIADYVLAKIAALAPPKQIKPMMKMPMKFISAPKPAMQMPVKPIQANRPSIPTKIAEEVLDKIAKKEKGPGTSELALTAMGGLLSPGLGSGIGAAITAPEGSGWRQGLGAGAGGLLGGMPGGMLMQGGMHGGSPGAMLAGALLAMAGGAGGGVLGSKLVGYNPEK